MAPPKKKSTPTSGAASRGGGSNNKAMSAESLLLNPHWRIGRQLGQGAQASVHALVLDVGRTNKESDDFVVKVAMLPDTMAPPKRKKSLLEINADTLNGEHICYHHLRAAQGIYIPRQPSTTYKSSSAAAEGESRASTPPLPPDRGQIVIDGKPKFRYLVLEKMDAPLVALVDRLSAALLANPSASKASSSNTATVSFGPIFVQMIQIVIQMHAAGRLINDVKADNWMLKKSSASASASSSSSASIEAQIQDMAREIRCLDLALARTYRDYTSAHRPDCVGDGVQLGTPLYASVHVHDGHTASRRDDLFSVGIVVAELLIRLHAKRTGTDHLYQPTSTDGGEPSYLPWATEPSERAMGQRMKALLFDPQSEFYQRLPETAAPILHKYFVRVHATGYENKPPYTLLLEMVTDLPIPRTVAGAAANAKASTKSPGRSAAGKKARGATSAAAAGLKSPPKNAAPSPTPKKRAAAATAAAAAAGVASPTPKKPAAAAAAKRSAASTTPASAASSNRTVASTQASSSSRGRTTRTAARALALAAAALEAHGQNNDDVHVGTWEPYKHTKPTAATATGTSARRQAGGGGGGKRPATDTNLAPPAKAKVGRRPAADASAADEDDVDEMEVDDSFCTAQTSPGDDDDDFEPMEIDNGAGDDDVDDDDDVEFIGVVPAASAAQKVKPSGASSHGLEVRISDGPNAGESYILAKGPGHPTSLILGSKPKRGQGATSVAIADPKIAPSLAKLTLVVMKSGTRTIEVQNLAVTKNGGSLRFNGNAVEEGKVHAFPGDSIQLGSSTVLSVAAFDGPPLPGKENAVRRTAAATATTTKASASRKKVRSL